MSASKFCFSFSSNNQRKLDSIQLKIISILNVPFDTYEDFYFIVNGEKFKTTRIISDLLSPKICQIHRVDPTVDSFTINTTNKGDFSKILQIINFEPNPLLDKDFDFLSEIVNILGNESIQIKIDPSKITKENVIELLEKHLKTKVFYSDTINQDIYIISHNFGEILENQEEKLMKFDIDILEKILNNQNLQIKDENQLLSFIIHLYRSDANYAPLFEYVLFQNVDRYKIIEFLNIFDYQYLTHEIWNSISQRLKQDIKSLDQNSIYQRGRYIQQVKQEKVIIFSLSNFKHYFIQLK